ncbi:hypothetical protein QN395_05190 [Undibacterium sp. RTI2.2]|uniref:hypothetical protein n=1 Tax=unclassified Undibacterium TaxID=2630295 RepID=UPI002AB3497D|nr:MULTISPECIES: hypothetical protein [unclassified Undibacterium]MDY7539050.1 hypothetical protein [Undibacterium sp. 5I1]MEB0115872.1 hypothetical protein [Undibacterium sp. RTI2.2]MEB0229816.1 hypothetical protein [Undibacterium sp. 10I3]MEB0258279.1 hypothetical protein [Undibacterium sp. 5I1]
MKIFSWFDATEEKQFGQILAEALIERTPVESAVGKILNKKHEAMLNKLSQLVIEFKQDRKMNTYKKAALGNTFKWELIKKGYDREYVDQLTNWIILKL